MSYMHSVSQKIPPEVSDILFIFSQMKLEKF